MPRTKKTIIQSQDEQEKKEYHLPELTIDFNGVKVLKGSGLIKVVENEMLEDLNVKDLMPDDFGLEKVMVVKKKTYTDAHRKAQQKYREKYPEKYYQQQKKVYDNKKDDPEWKAKFNERSKVNNAKYREKKKQEAIAGGAVIKTRGRPRKNPIEN